VNSLGFKDSQIQYFGGSECDQPVSSCVLIRVQPKANQADQDAVGAIKAKLGKGLQLPPRRHRWPQGFPGTVLRRRGGDAVRRSDDRDLHVGSNGNMESALRSRPAMTCW